LLRSVVGTGAEGCRTAAAAATDERAEQSMEMWTSARASRRRWWCRCRRWQLLLLPSPTTTDLQDDRGSWAWAPRGRPRAGGGGGSCWREAANVVALVVLARPTKAVAEVVVVVAAHDVCRSICASCCLSRPPMPTPACCCLSWRRLFSMEEKQLDGTHDTVQ
jgi:hypothetical protein